MAWLQNYSECAQPRVKLTRLRLRYAARFLVKLFRVKLGCVCKVGGQLTPSLDALAVFYAKGGVFSVFLWLGLQFAQGFSGNKGFGRAVFFALGCGGFCQ